MNKSLFFIASLFLFHSFQAQETKIENAVIETDYKPRIYTGLQFGTFGSGLQVVVPFAKRFDVRLGGTMIRPKSTSVNSTEDGADVTTDVTFKSSTGSLIIDFSLSKKKPGIKVAAGAFYNNTNLVINRSYYHAGYDLDLGKLNLDLIYKNKINPYLGMVFGNFKKSKVALFVFEMGMVYTGSPKLEFTGEGRIAPTANQSNTDQITSNVSGVKFYPYVNMQLNFYLSKRKTN